MNEPWWIFKKGIFNPCNIIFICSWNSAEPRMCFSCDFVNPGYRDIFREVSVKSENVVFIFRQIMGITVKMCAKDQCMYTGISPAGTGRRYFFIKHCAKGIINDFLDSHRIWLNLPSVIRSSFEGNIYEIPCLQQMFCAKNSTRLKKIFKKIW